MSHSYIVVFVDTKSAWTIAYVARAIHLSPFIIIGLGLHRPYRLVAQTLRFRKQMRTFADARPRLNCFLGWSTLIVFNSICEILYNGYELSVWHAYPNTCSCMARPFRYITYSSFHE